MDWQLSAALGFIGGVAAGALINWLLARRARTGKPSFRKLREGQAPQPTEARNVTADSLEEDRPATRQSTARFYPRHKNYTTKRKSQ